jgi:hypothetical protein
LENVLDFKTAVVGTAVRTMIYFPMNAPKFISLSRRFVFTMAKTDTQRELDGLQRLDAQVIGAVYDQYFSEVYRYVLYRVGDQTLAEDISSDVFVRLLEAAQSGQPPQTSLRGWLIGTASHIVMDHFRKYRRPYEETRDYARPR